MATPLPPEDFGPDLEALGAIGGLLTPRENYIPNLQSVYGDIIQNAADYQYFTAPLSNQGRTTATYGGQNNIVVAPDTPIRVVNNATGEVVYSGVGYEGAQGAIDAANALSASTGKKANWDIQVAGPTMQGFQSVSTDRPDTSALDVAAKVVGTALPVAVNFIPGLQGVGAILANAAAGAGGAALTGADPLKGALMGGLTSAGTQFLSPVVQSANGVATNLGRAVGTGVGAAAGGLATGKNLESSLLGGALAGGASYLGGELFGRENLASDELVSQNIDRALNNLENGLLDVGAFGDDLIRAAYKADGVYDSQGRVIPFSPDGTAATSLANNAASTYQSTNNVLPNDIVSTANVNTAGSTTAGANDLGLLSNITVNALRDAANAEQNKSSTTTDTGLLNPNLLVSGGTNTTTNTDTTNTTTDTGLLNPNLLVSGGTNTTTADNTADTNQNQNGTITVTGGGGTDTTTDNTADTNQNQNGTITVTGGGGTDTTTDKTTDTNQNQDGTITVTGGDGTDTTDKTTDTNQNQDGTITVTGDGGTDTTTDKTTDTNQNQDGTITVTGDGGTDTIDKTNDTIYDGNLPNIPSLVDDIVQDEIHRDPEKKNDNNVLDDILKYGGAAGTIYDLLKRLIDSGGGGTTPTTPYVSPFGTGPSFGTGLAQRTQVNPNIIDYERYGFGPEASFFSGTQTGPVTYKPLI